MSMPEGMLPRGGQGAAAGVGDLAGTKRTVEQGTTGAPTMPATPPPSGSPASAVPATPAGAPEGMQPRAPQAPGGGGSAQPLGPTGQGSITVPRGIFGLEKGRGPVAHAVNTLGDFLIPPLEMTPEAAAQWAAVVVPGGPALKGLNYMVPIAARAVSMLPGPIQRVVLGALTAEAADDFMSLAQGKPVQLGRGATEGAIGGTAGEVGATVIKGTIKGAVRGTQRMLDMEPARKRAADAAATATQRVAAVEKAADIRATAQDRVTAAQTKAAEVRGAATTARKTADTALKESEARAAGLAFDTAQSVPPLRKHLPGNKPAEELSNLGTFHTAARKDLGQYQTAAVADAGRMLPQGASTQIHVPAMARPNPVWGEGGQATKDLHAVLAQNGIKVSASGQPIIKGPTDAALVKLYTNQLSQMHGPKEIQHFTLTEIAEHLKDLGQGGWGQAGSAKVMDPRVPGHQSRSIYNEVMTQTEAALTGQGHGAAWDKFREGRHAFSVGATLIEVLQGARAFDRTMGTAAIDSKGLQDAVAARANELRQRMTPDEWRTLETLVFPKGVSSRTVSPGKLATVHKQATAAESQATAAEARVTSVEARARVAEARAAEILRRANNLTSPDSTYPWAVRALDRVFLNAAMTKAIHDSGYFDRNPPAPQRSLAGPPKSPAANVILKAVERLSPAAPGASTAGPPGMQPRR